MADRYARANGNWNDAIWAATSDGTAGSASTPTAADNVYVQGNSGSLTLDSDAECLSYNSLGGGVSRGSNLSLYGHKLWVHSDWTYGGDTTIDLGGGTLEIDGGFSPTDGNFYSVSVGSIILNISSNKTFNSSYISSPTNVILNLGEGTASSTVLDFSGSPTLSALIIQSKNSAAHTVNFDGGADVSITGKFIGIGSSSANKLTLTSPSTAYMTFGTALGQGATSYGQYLSIGANLIGEIGPPDNGPLYIGSNSIDDSGYWVLQNPPKISTLVDPLTTDPASNTNWTISGTVSKVTSGIGGGGYAIGSIPNTSGSITSTDTYDFLDSTAIFQVDASDIDVTPIFFALSPWFPRVSSPRESGGFAVNFSSTQTSGPASSMAAGPAGAYYVRLSLDSSNNTVTYDISSDGSIWDYTHTAVLSDTDLLLYRSVRIGASASPSGATASNFIVGSINVYPSPQPYSAQSLETLPSDDSTLSKKFTQDDYEDVETIDSVFYDTVGALTNVQLFKHSSTDNTKPAKIKWTGKSTTSAATKNIHLEVYNQTSGSWEQKDINTTATAGTIVTLSAKVKGAQYYDEDNYISARVWQ